MIGEKVLYGIVDIRDDSVVYQLNINRKYVKRLVDEYNRMHQGNNFDTSEPYVMVTTETKWTIVNG